MGASTKGPGLDPSARILRERDTTRTLAGSVLEDDYTRLLTRRLCRMGHCSALEASFDRECDNIRYAFLSFALPALLTKVSFDYGATDEQSASAFTLTFLQY